MTDVIIAYRVVADHIRCLTTAIADGAMPDSVGRGFVLRRIIRRAIRYGVQFLNAAPGFFSGLVESVSTSLGDFYPHLRQERTVQRIKAILFDEEQSFAKTW
uniref:Alanine--tRNA ligase, cytoplasmic n=1 Tax=Lygus hesperus TaxID=30085 RepID=A0A0A9YVK7_LYGHE